MTRGNAHVRGKASDICCTMPGPGSVRRAQGSAPWASGLPDKGRQPRGKSLVRALGVQLNSLNAWPAWMILRKISRGGIGSCYVTLHLGEYQLLVTQADVLLPSRVSNEDRCG